MNGPQTCNFSAHIVASAAMSLSPHTAIPISHNDAGVRPVPRWLTDQMERLVQLQPAHGYASPRTMKVRGVVHSMLCTSEGRDWAYLAHDYSGQERPRVRGSGMF